MSALATIFDSRYTELLTPLAPAQAEIERLTGLVEELSGLLATSQLCADQIQKHRLAAEEQVKVLSEALGPFSLLATTETYAGASMSDPLSKWFTIADLQHALAALQQKEG